MVAGVALRLQWDIMTNRVVTMRREKKSREYIMIKSTFAFVCAATLLPFAQAQTSSTTTTVSGRGKLTGTISEYTPGTALVLNTVSGEPVQFKLSKNVTFADADGKTVEAAGLTET